MRHDGLKPLRVGLDTSLVPSDSPHGGLKLWRVRLGARHFPFAAVLIRSDARHFQSAMDAGGPNLRLARSDVPHVRLNDPHGESDELLFQSSAPLFQSAAHGIQSNELHSRSAARHCRFAVAKRLATARDFPSATSGRLEVHAGNEKGKSRHFDSPVHGRSERVSVRLATGVGLP